ncbi:hypothetical protein BpHYR1_036682 [Brachionus plicatilis]|uniref:Uncharacterized protein n=1 Tax=Brachionus plicatilis TaxID=10195 RepID=A0A3M7QKA9_BRAPC|nr:hypothetical protein BpHYR1_036682 [Brachionus plicatilis]
MTTIYKDELSMFKSKRKFESFSQIVYYRLKHHNKKTLVPIIRLKTLNKYHVIELNRFRVTIHMSRSQQISIEINWIINSLFVSANISCLNQKSD